MRTLEAAVVFHQFRKRHRGKTVDTRYAGKRAHAVADDIGVTKVQIRRKKDHLQRLLLVQEISLWTDIAP